MKNLDNKEILPDKICEAIKRIIGIVPDVVFGGSIALNAVGLLNRPVKDIDLFFPIGSSLTKGDFLYSLQADYEAAITSDTVTDVDGEEIQRTGVQFGDIKICCFKVKNEQLESTKHTFSRWGDLHTIHIQNVNHAIVAKQTYASKNMKHELDLKEIQQNLEKIL